MSRALLTIGLLCLFLRVTPALAQNDPRPDIIRVYRVAGAESLHAHVFLPPGHRAADRSPAILLFHGGGWSAGSPDWTYAAARRFADWGMVAIAIQYRLSNGDVTPLDALDDACAAFEWARGQAHDLGLSGRLAGYGVSAGGYLVASTTTVGCAQDSLPANPAGPEALVLWSPALDLTSDRWFQTQLGKRATAAEVSPAHHVRASTPPTSIVHGDKDTLTPLVGVTLYCESMAKLGKPCDLHVYPGLGHLLTRDLANQESGYDPDPAARTDGIAQQRRFLERQGFIAAEPQK